MMYQALRYSDAFELKFFELTPETLARIPVADFYVFNYHHATMAWLNTKSIRTLPGVKFTFVLEMLPGNPFVYCNSEDFDAYLVLDPSMRHANKKVFAFTRPLEKVNFVHPYQEKEIPVIGTFGFGTPGKGFELVVDAVNREFDRAIIRLNIPYATYADNHTFSLQKVNYTDYLVQLAKKVAKPGIEVQFSNLFMSKEELITWCSENTLNCFLYCRNQPGLAATTDQCISSGRPLIVSNNDTFRHIHEYIKPYPEISLREAIATSQKAIHQMQIDWSPELFAQKFEKVLENFSLLPQTSKEIEIQQKVSKKEKIILLNSDNKKSKIQQHGLVLAEIINKSKQYSVEVLNVNNYQALENALNQSNPQHLIINYCPKDLSWIKNADFKALKAKKIGLIHQTKDIDLNLFNQCIVLDSSYNIELENVVRINSVLPLYCNQKHKQDSFELGIYFEEIKEEDLLSITKEVESNYDVANIFLTFSPEKNNLNKVREIVTKVKAQLFKKHISFIAPTEDNDDINLPLDQLQDIFAYCNMNILLADPDQKNPELSIIVDLALSVQRPLAINNSPSFKQILDQTCSFCLEEKSILEINHAGIAPQVPLYNDFSEARFILDFEKALSSSKDLSPKEKSDLNSESILNYNLENRTQYGIAVFKNIGDVLCCTPIARQLKVDEPNCFITWFTSQMGEVALRNNPDIDELVVLEDDPEVLNDSLEFFKELKPWKRFFTPAAYMNYDAIAGGSINNVKGTVFGLVKAGAKLNWTVPFVFTLKLTAEEISQARNYWSNLPSGIKILVETSYRSEQTPWNQEYLQEMLWELKDLNPYFVFTSKEKPELIEEFLAVYPRACWCNLPFRLNAELFNLADAFIGVSSGISCLTYSDHCRSDLPRIEVTRGEHWGAAELNNHSELFLCYSKRRFNEALKNLVARLSGQELIPDFSKRLQAEQGCCQYCGSMKLISTARFNFAGCYDCKAIFRKGPSINGQSYPLSIKTFNGSCKEIGYNEFINLNISPATLDEVQVHSGLGSIANLAEFFEKVDYLLKPSGIFKCQVPNFDSLCSNSKLNSWAYLEKESPYFHFSPKFLKECLIQAGFVVESCETETPMNMEEEALNILKGAKAISSLQELNSFYQEIKLRGAGEIINLVARKRGNYKGRVKNNLASNVQAVENSIEINLK